MASLAAQNVVALGGEPEQVRPPGQRPGEVRFPAGPDYAAIAAALAGPPDPLRMPSTAVVPE